jgi:capsular polysaccharide biosynthesis protein
MKLKVILKKIKNRINYHSRITHRYIFYKILTLTLKRGYKLARFEDVCMFRDSIALLADGCSTHDTYTIVGEPEILSREVPITLDQADQEIFMNAIRPMNIGCNVSFPPPFIACLHNADVMGDYCLLRNSSGYIISDSTWSPQHLVDTGIFDRPLPRRRMSLKGKYILLGMHWWNEYYHWMIEILPRLALIQSDDQLKQLPLLLPGSLKKYHHESLQLLNISSQIIEMEPNSITSIEQMFFISSLSSTPNPSGVAVNWLKSAFHSITPLEESPKRIYVARSDANRRRLLNEDEISSFLASSGFSIICPSDYSLKQQIQIFKAAELVIGCHGAGLSSIVFMEPGSKVIEIFPRSDLYVGCYWSLANLCKLDYGTLIGTEPLNIFGDFELSLDKLMEFMSIR